MLFVSKGSKNQMLMIYLSQDFSWPALRGNCIQSPEQGVGVLEPVQFQVSVQSGNIPAVVPVQEVQIQTLRGISQLF